MRDFEVGSVAVPSIWLIVAAFLIILFSVELVSKRARRQSVGWRAIPQPWRLPVVGNLLQLDMKEPLTSLNEIGKQYPDVFRMDLPGTSLVIINSHRLYDEVCDNKRFHKEPVGGILEARNGGGDGLFSAYTDEEAWGIAHRILTPSFGQQGVKEIFDDMSTLTNVLIEKWESLPPNHAFSPWDEFSQLALDIISQSAFDLPLDSLRNDEIPQFAHSITDFFSESGKRALRPSFITKFVFWKQNRYYWKCIEDFQSYSRQVINKRRGGAKKKPDILHAMLEDVDPVTGKKMSDQNCVYNTLSLLGAGYETLSSMLSWILISLVQNPRCLQILRQELDEKLCGGTITKQDLDRLPYLTACIRESERLYPSAPAHSLKLRKEAITEDEPGLGREQYLINRRDIIRVNLLAIQRDPLVWGEDAEEFKPERMLEDNFSRLPRNAWKPFGTGVRICLGRYFALQEAHIVISTLVQNFDFKFVDDRCRCVIGETLILRPLHCTMQVTKRNKP